MENKIGVDNLKKLIALPIELGNVADMIGSEDSKSWRRWFKLVNAFDEVIDLLRVDWNILKNEIKDFNSEDMTELNSFMKEKFDIKNDNLEKIVEDSIAILISLGELVEKSIALYKTNS